MFGHMCLQYGHVITRSCANFSHVPQLLYGLQPNGGKVKNYFFLIPIDEFNFVFQNKWELAIGKGH